MKNPKLLEKHIKGGIRELCRFNGAWVGSFYGGTNLPPGWPDLVVVHQGQIYLIEVKRPGYKLHEDQEKLRAELEARGVTLHCVSSLEEVAEICGFQSKIAALF